MINNLKSNAPIYKKSQFEWILIAKGIGISLVVLGHYFPTFSPEYWVEMRKVIYTFHMPLFFLLSGYLYNQEKYSYENLVINKVRRLVYPFISIAIIFFVIKYIAGIYVTLGYPVSFNSLLALITDPVNSYMPLLWFVHTLFFIFIVYPLLRLVLNEISILMLILSINVIFGTDIYVFGNVLEYMPYFIMGALLKEKYRFSEVILKSNYTMLIIFLFAFIVVYLLRVQDGMANYIYVKKFLLGLLGSIFIVNISKQLSNSEYKNIKKYIASVGVYSMSIYLFHTLFESALRIGLSVDILHVVIPFELTAIISVLFGIVSPLLLEKYFLRKNKLSRKYILGIK